DGSGEGMGEVANVPYVGAGVVGSAVAMDKAIAKTILAQAGLPQVPWLGVLRRDWERDPDRLAQQIADTLGFPCFTKPANLGSSVGISQIPRPGELPPGVDAAARFCPQLIVPEGVDARQVAVPV